MRIANKLKTRFFGAFATAAVLSVAALLPSAAHAQTMYSIGEDLWRYDLSGTTATATKIKDFASTFWTVRSNGNAGTGNSLAFDNVHNQLIFSDGSSKTLYSYNLSTSTMTTLGTLSISGFDLTNYNTGGLASFYNGKYYIMPEQITASNATAAQPWNFMVEVSLNAAGTGITATTIIGGTTDSPNKNWGTNVSNGFGNGGDMAFDKNGKIYGFSSAVTSNPTGTQSISGYFTANITSPTSGVTVNSTTTALQGGQAAYQNGVLYHSTATTANNVTTYTIESRNQSTGAAITTYNLSGFNDAQGIADMASPLETPEPGSIALMVSAGAFPLGGVFLRLRRKARKSVAPASA